MVPNLNRRVLLYRLGRSTAESHRICCITPGLIPRPTAPVAETVGTSQVCPPSAETLRYTETASLSGSWIL